ncbi:hypothetical protein TTRE_0000697901 [Trichuris trichiura]|uniref:Uncharacterized protein n=1 Tax=Trichuris trichiura TaxID=36087 RepID=A0A077ZJD4_TRITR|nr:hypothetical protein TTRE_0000697901 [Trichuris trichiura]
MDYRTLGTNEMRCNIANSLATGSGSLANNGAGNLFVTNTWQPAPAINEAPMNYVHPALNVQEQNYQVPTAYRNYQICTNSQGYNGAVPFVPNSSVGNRNSVAYRAMPPRQENFSGSWRSHATWFPPRANVRLPVFFGREAPAKNYAYNYGTAVKLEPTDVAISSPSVLLNRTDEANSTRTALGSSQVGNLSNRSLNSKPKNYGAKYGSLTPDGRHMICRSCNCCVALADGTFSNFVQHLKLHCFSQPKPKNYEAPLKVTTSNPIVPVCAPVTIASVATSSSRQNAAPTKKRVKTSEPTAGQLHWAQYAIYAGFGESFVCKLCGPESFPFLCLDGFQKHLDIFHSAEISKL